MVASDIKTRKAKLAELRIPPPVPLDREKFLTDYGRIRYSLTQRHPQQVRAVLKKLGITQIVPRPDPAGGWTFTGTADLACLTSVPVGEASGPEVRRYEIEFKGQVQPSPDRRKTPRRSLVTT